MTSRTRLWENMASLFVLQGANYILPLITLPFLVRTLGPEKFGLIAVAQAVAQYFIILTDYGFNFTATRQISLHRDNPERVSEIFTVVMAIKFILVLISFALLTIAVYLIPQLQEDSSVYYAAFLAVVGNALFPLWLFQGLEKMKLIMVANLIAKISTTAALFLYIRQDSDYLMAVSIQSLGIMLSGIIGIIFSGLYLKIHITSCQVSKFKSEIIEGWPIFISTAAVSLYTSTNTIIVGLLTSTSIAGHYSAGEKLIRATQSLVSPISQAIFPHVSALAGKSREGTILFLRKSLRYISIGTFCLSLLLFILAPQLILLMFGEDFLPSVQVVRILSLLPFIVGVSNILGVQTMLAFGMNKQFSHVLLSAGIVNLLMIVPFVYSMGAGGAASTMLLTETFVLVSMGVILKREGIDLFSKRGYIT